MIKLSSAPSFFCFSIVIWPLPPPLPDDAQLAAAMSWRRGLRATSRRRGRCPPQHPCVSVCVCARARARARVRACVFVGCICDSMYSQVCVCT